MLGFSGNKSSSNKSDDNESSDKHNWSSTNDSKDSKRNSDGGADDSDVTQQCQEEESEVSFKVTQALQWTHTTVEVQKTMAPTGTHLNALLTMSPLINRYFFNVHLYTVSRNMLHLLKKKNIRLLLLLLFKTDWVL